MLPPFPPPFSRHNVLRCQSLATACSASQYTSLPGAYLLPPPPLHPKNTCTFLVCVGRFNKLPSPRLHSHTHTTHRLAVNHDRILPGNQYRCFVAYCRLLDYPSYIFPDSTLCLQHQWPLTSYDPTLFETRSRSTNRKPFCENRQIIRCKHMMCVYWYFCLEIWTLTRKIRDQQC